MKSKSTNLARGVFSWFCFLLCIFSIIGGLTFVIYYGQSIFDEGGYLFREIGQALSGDLRETDTYKENASALFERLYYSTQGDAAANSNTDEDADADEGAVASSSYHFYVSRDDTGTTVSTVYVESISKDDLYSVTGKLGRKNAAEGIQLPVYLRRRRGQNLPQRQRRRFELRFQQ